MTQEKHKSQRSVIRMFGQTVDPNGNVTGAPVEVRVAHCYLHTKRTKSAGGDPLEKPRYDAVILVPKISTDPARCPNYKLLSDMAMEAAVKAWGAWPENGKWPIDDGDVPHKKKYKPGETPLTPEQIAAKNAWRTGSWVIEVSINPNFDTMPRVAIVQNGMEVEVPAQTVNGVQYYKSGDYGCVSMNAYTFQNKTFGVNYGFEGICFTRPGEAIGGNSGPRSVTQMFGGVAQAIPTPLPGPATGTVAAPIPNVGAGPAPGYAPPPMPPAAPSVQGYVQPGPTSGAVAAPVAPHPPAAPMPPMPPGPR